MSNNKPPLEALLRPPLEWWTTASTLVAGVFVFHWPRLFMLRPHVAFMYCTVLMSVGLYRFYQGWRIYRYQHGLKKQRRYTLKATQVPISQKTLFLGKGFRWQPMHTQRLRDLDLPVFQHYRYKIQNRLSKAGGDTALHGVSFKEQSISIPLTDRAGHLLVLGTTGVGKTRFAELMISQDILRGDTVIVIDPKGDVGLFRQMLIAAEQAQRLEAIHVLHLGFPEQSSSYNPIGDFTRTTEVASRITQSLPSQGDSAAFKAFAWQFIHVIVQGLQVIDTVPTYASVAYYLSQLETLLIEVLKQEHSSIESELEEWRQKKADRHQGKLPSRQRAIHAYLKTHTTSQPEVVEALLDSCAYERDYYDKISASVRPLLKKLTTGALRELLSPTTNTETSEKKALHWLNVIEDKKIIYVGLDALTDSTVASAVGNALLADLVSLAGRLYKASTTTNTQTMPRICLHVDEFNEVIGDEFMPLLNKARGVGFQVTAYTQTWSDVEARLGSTAKAGQVAGNFNTLVMFRVKERKTARLLLDQLPQVPFKKAVPVSSAQETTEKNKAFRAINEDRLHISDVAMLSQSDIVNLPKGEAFALIDGGKLFKLRIPELKALKNAIDLPMTFPALIKYLKTKPTNPGE